MRLATGKLQRNGLLAQSLPRAAASWQPGYARAVIVALRQGALRSASAALYWFVTVSAAQRLLGSLRLATAALSRSRSERRGLRFSAQHGSGSAAKLGNADHENGLHRKGSHALPFSARLLVPVDWCGSHGLPRNGSAEFGPPSTAGASIAGAARPSKGGECHAATFAAMSRSAKHRQSRLALTRLVQQVLPSAGQPPVGSANVPG